MNLTEAFTGALPATVIVSAVLTAFVSFFLLWLYRRAVIRGMDAKAGAVVAAVPPIKAANGPQKSPFLSLSFVDATVLSQPSAADGGEYQRAIQSLNQTSLAYALGGLGYALVMTTAWMITLGDGFILTRFAWLFSCHCWPTVLAVGFINPVTWKQIAIGYCVLMLLIAGIVVFRNPGLTAGDLLYFWLSVNGLATILLVVFLNRRVRAVGPLVLALMLAAVTGAVIVVDLVGSNEELMRGLVKLGGALRLGALPIFVLLHIVGAALFGLLCWQLLRWLGWRYQHKQMSDQSITLDAMWLLFGVVQSYAFVFDGIGWLFTGIVAFAAYKLVSWAALRYFSRLRSAKEGTRTLLLLRVFSLGRRSQRLFDLLSKIWLRRGNISLISGPDLVTTTVEPHEFLEFLAGRLSRRFVQGKEDLEQRVSEMDSLRDPDGRYRVHEFFCRDDTWRMTVERLAQKSHAVLMDLRSFSEKNHGCIFEIRQLIEHVPFENLVLTIDDSTNRAFLEQTVKTLYQQVGTTSPNFGRENASLSLFRVKAKGYRPVEDLLRLLFRAPQASHSP
jgi:hypothetical protein